MNTDAQRTFDQLCAFVEKTMKRRGIPGVAVGVLCQGKTDTAGFGVTNVDHSLPVTDETLFQIGSITKTFTSLAVMRLVEQGKLDLDATVRTYLPGFCVADETASAQATVRHLLIHTAGWAGDLFLDTGPGDDASAKYVAKMADLQQLAPLGAVWSYNNASFYLVGHLIEQVTDETYEQALKDLVLEPLELEHCYLDPGDVMTHRFAVGHHAGADGAEVARPWPLPRAARPAGGLICDVKALLRYAQFQMGDGATEDGRRLLQPETMSSMHAPHFARWGEKEQMALSWFLDDVDSARQLSHGGGTVGQVTLLAILPDRGFAVAALTNADEGGALTDDVRRWALQHYLGLSEPKPEPIESPTDELAVYAGRYVRPFAEIELGMLGGRLLGQMTYKAGFPSQDAPPAPPPPPAALALYERDRLLITEGPAKGARAEVIRLPDGSIGWLRLGRIYRKQVGPAS